MMSQADAMHVFLVSAMRQLQLNPNAKRGCSQPSSCAFRLPPGLCVPPPPGLGLAPPPGLELPEAAGGGYPAPARECGRSGSKWESDCSTADSTEVSTSPSPAGTPRKGLPPTPELRCVGAPQGAEASSRAFEEQDRAYMPGRLLLEVANSQDVAPLQLPGAAPPELAPPVPTCPSVGSLGHGAGLCKPCDFTYRNGGCREGAACKFCHLCGPEVSRRRKKERKQFLNATYRCPVAGQ
mmetsp:Transcript_15830/g.32082  ORF Transcript_15830/g.32082 Transcript_15830/m.32082 type:complete len:238 (+) Transcript_15830:95-808(+)